MRTAAVVVVVLFMLPGATLGGEVLKYIDENGVVNFVDGMDKIPEKYRNRVEPRSVSGDANKPQANGGLPNGGTRSVGQTRIQKAVPDGIPPSKEDVSRMKIHTSVPGDTPPSGRSTTQKAINPYAEWEAKQIREEEMMRQELARRNPPCKLSKDQIQPILWRLFKDMGYALRRGDIDKALTYFSRSSQIEWKRRFGMMDKDTLERISAEDLIGLRINVYSDGYFIEAGVIRKEDKLKISYPIHFCFEEGEWRIIGF